MRQIIHSLYQAKEVTQKVYNNMMIKQCATDALTTASKKQFKKQQKQLVI